MRAFITGIAGFLGSVLAEHLQEQGHYVSGCDNLSAGDQRNVPQGITYTLADCREALDLRGFDVVYHCAAHPHEGLSVFSPRTICSSIYEASVSVFSSAAAAGVKRVVFCSSMSRYGDNPVPFFEEQAANPRDPYAIAKVAAEETLKVLAKTHGFEHVIAVPHNIVGRNQKYDDPFRNVAAIMANRMLLGMQPIVYGDGQQTRCFSDVRDVISILGRLGTHPGADGQTFNLGPDEGVTTIESMGRTLAAIVGVDWNPLRLPDRPCEVKHAHCSSDKIRTWFNYETRFDLGDMLVSLVNHIKSRGPSEFDYYLPVEIVNDKTPKFWTERI
jgi:UDP-glucose 4-epimerase